MVRPANPDSLLYPPSSADFGDDRNGWCGGHCKGLFHCVACHDEKNPRLRGY
jgi:hypothetical protein